MFYLKYTGAYVSFTGGIENALLNANKIVVAAFALFTKNQQQWLVNPLKKENESIMNDNRFDGITFIFETSNEKYQANKNSII